MFDKVMPQGRRGVPHDHSGQRPGSIPVENFEDRFDRRLVCERGEHGQMRPGHDSIQVRWDVEHGGRDQRPTAQRKRKEEDIQHEVSGVGCRLLETRHMDR